MNHLGGGWRILAFAVSHVSTKTKLVQLAPDRYWVAGRRNARPVQRIPNR